MIWPYFVTICHPFQQNHLCPITVQTCFNADFRLTLNRVETFQPPGSGPFSTSLLRISHSFIHNNIRPSSGSQRGQMQSVTAIYSTDLSSWRVLQNYRKKKREITHHSNALDHDRPLCRNTADKDRSIFTTEYSLGNEKFHENQSAYIRSSHSTSE